MGDATITRFWSKVRKLGDDLYDCWDWTGTTFNGYGFFGGKGVHRFAYELLIGPVPNGLHIDHLCRNRACVRPEHLEPVTPQENSRRGFGVGAINARKTHCKRGHEFTPENTYLRYGHERICRACQLALEREHMKRARGLFLDYQCPDCGARFQTRTGRSLHVTRWCGATK